MEKVVYQTDIRGVLITTIELNSCYRDPRRDRWAVPRGCIEIEPPEEKKGFDRVWDGAKWLYQEQPKGDTGGTEPESPTIENHEHVDSNILDLAEAVLELSDRLEKIEGDKP